MKIMRKLPARRVLLVNYIGGVGYYAFHFAWTLSVFLASLSVMQYIVFGGQPVLYVPGPVTDSSTAVVPAPEWLGVIAGALAGVVLLVFLTLLPYWLGYVSKGVPRWVLRQTSWKCTLSSLHAVKQVGVLIVFAAALVAFYVPKADYSTNIPFLIVLSACLVSSCAFALQYKIAAFMKLHERSVY